MPKISALLLNLAILSASSLSEESKNRSEVIDRLSRLEGTLSAEEVR